MFEAFDYQSYLSGFASAVSILLAIIGFAGWFKSKRKKIYTENIREDFGVSGLPAPLSVSFSTHEFTSRTAVVDHHIISNRAGVTLTNEDFAEGFSLPILSEGTVFFCRFLDFDGNGDATSSIMGDRITIDNLFIPRKMGVIMEIAHDGCVGRQLQCVPKSLPDIKSKRFTPFFDSSTFFVLYFTIILAILIFQFLKLTNIDDFDQTIWEVFGVQFLTLFGSTFLLGLSSFLSLRNWRKPNWITRLLGHTDTEATFIVLKYRAKRKKISP